MSRRLQRAILIGAFIGCLLIVGAPNYCGPDMPEWWNWLFNCGK